MSPETVQIGVSGGTLVTLIGVLLRNGKGHVKEHMEIMGVLTGVKDKLGEVAENTKGLGPAIATVLDHVDAHDLWERTEKVESRAALTKHDENSRADRERVREHLDGHDRREGEVREQVRDMVRQVLAIIPKRRKKP